MTKHQCDSCDPYNSLANYCAVNPGTKEQSVIQAVEENDDGKGDRDKPAFYGLSVKIEEIVIS